MLRTDIFTLEKLDYAMVVKKGVALIILVSLPVVQKMFRIGKG